MADGQECSLTQADVIMRLTDTPDADGKVNVSVASSKKSDCAAGKLAAVSVDDLQEMRNRFEEQLGAGLKSMASKQETGQTPKAPDTGTVAFVLELQSRGFHWDVRTSMPLNRPWLATTRMLVGALSRFSLG
jgi:hypothetical protein